ncbi:hypothetical protein, partial [Gilliamella apicola]|uniref:hypothetical protein n=1 Tax=Gilliamella apicola TaxID=1196095 RepID=UPI001C0B4CA7
SRVEIKYSNEKKNICYNNGYSLLSNCYTNLLILKYQNFQIFIQYTRQYCEQNSNFDVTSQIYGSSLY